MNKKIKALIILVSILILCSIGYWIYYLVAVKDYGIVKNGGNGQPQNNIPTPAEPTSVTPTEEEYKNQVAVDYPDMVTGTISFQSGDKATIKTADGKIYTFTPNQPQDVYKAFGLKSGDKVEVQAKILDSNLIKWIMIKAIE